MASKGQGSIGYVYLTFSHTTDTYLGDDLGELAIERFLRPEISSPWRSLISGGRKTRPARYLRVSIHIAFFHVGF